MTLSFQQLALLLSFVLTLVAYSALAFFDVPTGPIDEALLILVGGVAVERGARSNPS